MAAARYRDRHGVSRKKSDPGDALVLANILRTDMPMHRPLPADTDLARAIAVLARAQQDATWNRQQIANQLRSLLREYCPAALDAFAGWTNGLCRSEARELLKLAPTPSQAARLTRAQLRSTLKRAGRSRGIEAEADRLREVFRGDYASQPQLVEDALGKQTFALLRQLEAACLAADELAEAVEEAFVQHPDAKVILSFPGLGVQLGARVLAEIGDDRQRFVDARGMKAYAGSASVTRASGKKHHVGRRTTRSKPTSDRCGSSPSPILTTPTTTSRPGPCMPTCTGVTPTPATPTSSRRSVANVSVSEASRASAGADVPCRRKLNGLTNACGRSPKVQQSTGQTHHSRVRPDAGEASIALRMRCSSTRSWGVTIASLRSYSAARAASARSRACVPSAVSTSR